MNSTRLVQQVMSVVSLLLLFSAHSAAANGSPPAGSPKTNWIKIEGTPPFVMLADTDKVSMPLLVTLEDGIQASEVSLRLLGVRYEKLVDQRIAASFQVAEKIQDSADRGPTLSIQVDLSPGLRPGNYELIIEARNPKKDALRLTVALEKPAVKLTQPAKLTIVQQYPFPLFGGDSLIYPKQLIVDQDSESKFARAQGFEFYQGGYKQGDGSPSLGSIKVTPKVPLPPGEPLVADLELGKFLVGTTTGNIQIRGADLKEPKTVEVEVRTRRSPDWIWLMIGLGLLFGWLLRSFLQGRVELGQAKQEAQKFLEALPSRPDSQFQEDIRPAIDALQDALAKNDRNGIVNKTKDAQEALKTATEDWKTRFKETDQALADLSQIFSRQYHLPPEIADTLAEARQSLDQARVSLKAGNEVKARTAKEKLKYRLVSQMSQKIAPWQENVRRWLDSLAALGFALDENLSNDLGVWNKQLSGQIDNVKIPTIMEKEVPTALEAVHDIQVTLASLLQWLSRQVSEDAKKYGGLLKTKGLNDPPGIADLEKKAATLVQELEAAAGALDPAKPPFNTQTREDLKNAYRELLEQALSPVKASMTEADLLTITTATYNGRYFKAAEVLPVQLPKGTVLGVQPGGPPQIGPTPWQPQWEPPARGAAVGQMVPVIELPNPIEVMRARTVKELFLAKTAQTLIVGAAIAVLGYLFFAENFVGTTKDMAAIFFWGFGLDVSMDNLLGLAAKLPGPKK